MGDRKQKDIQEKTGAADLGEENGPMEGWSVDGADPRRNEHEEKRTQGQTQVRAKVELKEWRIRGRADSIRGRADSRRDR